MTTTSMSTIKYSTIAFDENRNMLKQLDSANDTSYDVIKKSIHNILVALGADPNREGLKNTPDRVARAYNEIFQGMNFTNEDIAEMYNTCFEDVETGDLVVVSDISFFSMCEHHILPMVNCKAHIGYLPKGKVIGLSKIARIVDMCSKRLQLQERLGMDIAQVLEIILGTEDIIVVLEGEHTCMTMRGIKKPGTKTRTSALRGKFKDDSDLRNEFYSLVLTN